MWSPSRNVGLVIIYPASGKITYWDNIDSAESLKFFDQRRQGVGGILQGSWAVRTVEENRGHGNSRTGGLWTSSGRAVAQLRFRSLRAIPQIGLKLLPQLAKG